jgi:triosephosphate isomerase
VLIAGNWKMFKTPSETAEFCAALRDREAELEDTDVVVCPPYTSLHHAVSVLAGTSIAVFGQSVHWASEGPYTGEVSATMLGELGVTGAIVAHSERRQLFAETDETAALRVEGALDGGLSVIACVGETESEREAGETDAVLRRQVEALRVVVDEDHLDRLALAYEPVWAIGTGRTALPDDAGLIAGLIREQLRETLNTEMGEQVRILYGGSVNPGNIKDFMAKTNIDGALVGGASLDPDQFAAIVRYRI